MALGGINSRFVYAVRPQPSGMTGYATWLKADKGQPSHAANSLPLLFLRISHWASIAYRENVRNRMILKNRGRGGGTP